ncbi:hypothetical protein [Methylobacter sp. BlB1]|uniref:hypothetical protein n=1 Tax=Methylobacter sp. BlB1 TaxID=2785914 RepID=UPI00189314A1|nr:hypothetical protein [Methylobacter sp. BlB1]MBF6650706.1 hypothetical protein [Methylobacter sp. BlB1]
MNLLIPVTLLLCTVLTGCAAKRAAADCETMGFIPGSVEFAQCAERLMSARRANAMEYQRLQTEIAVQCEKSSHGIFGRNTGRTDCPH